LFQAALSASLGNTIKFLGYVETASLEAAELAAAKRFGLSEFHRRRLLLQERI
jgi:hypothetical protein